jgi:hypothetical protein
MANRVSEIIAERQHADKELSNDKTKRRYVFHFSWTAPRGEKYEGTFINNILTTGDRAEAESLASRFVDGVPWESINPQRRKMVEVLAHLTVSLDMEERPPWAKNFGDIIDEDVIALLFQEVDLHEVTFRRPKADTPRSDADSRNDEGNQDS